MNATSGRADSSHIDDSGCADLVLELVTVAQRDASLDHAASCPQCEARLRAHAGAAERSRADWRERADAVSRAPIPGPPRPHALATPPRDWLVALAAMLLVAIALPMLLSRPLVRGPSHGLPSLGEEVRTREGETEDPHLNAGLEAYRAHDLAAADRELALARGEGSGEQMRLLYLADVRDQRGDTRSALQLLRELQWRNLPEPWRHDGVVLFVRVLRANGHTASADSIEHALRALPPGTPFVP